MIRHYRDYEFDATQQGKPPGEHQHRTLCGRDLRPILASREETLAFFWCPSEKVECEACRAGRKRLEANGTWPKEHISTPEGGSSLDTCVEVGRQLDEIEREKKEK